MKKLNRISQNNGSAPSVAQAKQPSRKVAKRPKREIGRESRNLLERLAKMRSAPTKAAEVRKKTSPALVNELRHFLGAQSFAVLAGLEKEFGCSIETQLAGAIGTWLAFVEDERREHWQRSDDYLRRTIKEEAGILDPGQVKFIISPKRPNYVSKRAAQFFLLTLRHQMERPFNEARPILEGLRDIIEDHPGFAEQTESLQMMLSGGASADSFAMADRAGLPHKF